MTSLSASYIWVWNRLIARGPTAWGEMQVPPNALTLDAALNVYRTATTGFVQKPGDGSMDRKDAVGMVVIWRNPK